MSYAREKLLKAMYSLIGEGSQRDRLCNATVGSLIYVPVNELPESMRKDFSEFLDSLRVVKDESKGAVQATIDTFNDSQVDRAVDKILGFYSDLVESV